MAGSTPSIHFHHDSRRRRGGKGWSPLLVPVGPINRHQLLDHSITGESSNSPIVLVEITGQDPSRRESQDDESHVNDLAGRGLRRHGPESFHFQDLNPDGPPASYVQKAIANPPRSRGEDTWKVGPQKGARSRPCPVFWFGSSSTLVSFQTSAESPGAMTVALDPPIPRREKLPRPGNSSRKKRVPHLGQPVAAVTGSGHPLRVKPDGLLRDHHRPHGSLFYRHGLQSHPGALATRDFCGGFRLLLDA